MEKSHFVKLPPQITGAMHCNWKESRACLLNNRDILDSLPHKVAQALELKAKIKMSPVICGTWGS